MTLRFSLATTILGIVASGVVWHTGVHARRPGMSPDVSVTAASQAFQSRTPPLKSIVNLPLAFEANRGQAATSVRFLARSGRSNLLLTAQSIEVESNEPLGITFARANPGCEPQGVNPLPGRRNYIIGNDRSKWHTEVATFGRVSYRDLYPGIDLTFYGNQNDFEYDFQVNPGADASSIRFAIQGARPRITAHGDLILKRWEAEL